MLTTIEVAAGDFADLATPALVVNLRFTGTRRE